MTDPVPSYVYLVFILITIATVWLFCRSLVNPKTTAIILAAWLILQGVLSFSGFYLKINKAQAPYQLPLLMAPVIVTIILLFATAAGRRYLDRFDLKKLTWVHTVRVVVELVIWWWWVYKLVPKSMTFEGANFDILSGITAILVAIFLNSRLGINKNLLLAWNFICLLLVLNILVRGILSVPTPFQKFGLDQPNIAILYFPFIWLPACIVPLVILSHLVAIRKLLK